MTTPDQIVALRKALDGLLKVLEDTDLLLDAEQASIVLNAHAALAATSVQPSGAAVYSAPTPVCNECGGWPGHMPGCPERREIAAAPEDRK